MAIANPRIHIICGVCGNNKMLTYSIKPEIDDHDESRSNNVVYVTCKNCDSVTALDEIIKSQVTT
jgi:hypothetical protein